MSNIGRIQIRIFYIGTILLQYCNNVMNLKEKDCLKTKTFISCTNYKIFDKSFINLGIKC